MKTRIIYTKFWNDTYVSNLKVDEKLMFAYLMTNEFVGLLSVYELQDRRITFDLGITQERLEEIKNKFEEDKKFYFKGGWIGVVNGEKYNQYKGEKNENAKKKEYELINKDIVSHFQNRVSIGYLVPPDTTINHKSEIINKKSKTKNHKSEIGNKKYNDVRKKFNLKSI